MADEIQKLYDLPDVSFIDDITFDQILNENITNWQNEYEQETGKKKILRPGDKEYIQIKIEAGQWFQMYKQLDFAAKQNLLKYSTGDFLKHLGSMKKTFINEPKAAVTTVRFILSEIRREVVYIPAEPESQPGTEFISRPTTSQRSRPARIISTSIVRVKRSERSGTIILSARLKPWSIRFLMWPKLQI